jgi:hypothetical protein
MSEERDDSGQPEAYLAAHVREALATDPRVSELGLQVRIVSGRVFVHGVVPTNERRDAISVVVAELLPELEIHNATTVESPAVANGAETI